MSLRSSFLPFSLVVFAFGCSSSTSSGTAPTIKDFTLSPSALTVGTTPTVSGTLTIDDPDGDLAGGGGDVTFPDGRVVPLQEINLSSSAMSVPVMLTIPNLPVTLPGNYVVAIQARDAAGNESNRATVTLVAK